VGRLGFTPTDNMTLHPGKEIDLQELKFELKPANERKPNLETLYGTGKFRIKYQPLASPEIDRVLNNLATGTLELEIKSDPPPPGQEPESSVSPRKPEVKGAKSPDKNGDRLDGRRWIGVSAQVDGVTSRHSGQPGVTPPSSWDLTEDAGRCISVTDHR